MANKNVNPPSRPNRQVEKDMRKLECPFTWSMNTISKEASREYYLNEEEESFPLLHLLNHIMIVFVDIKSKNESDVILKGLEKCDEILAILRESNHPEISTDAAQYVLQSMKCFVFAQLNLRDELRQVFAEIRIDWEKTSKEKSTLKACRSIYWSKYHPSGASEAEQYIRDAIRENSNCALWHFLLGKYLRRRRRDLTMETRPCKSEVKSFKKAYYLSANPLFGIYLAQMHREMRKPKDAESVYNKIFEKNPTGTSILLRLAFGFVRLKNYAKAKLCLAKLGAVRPSHGMYLHYRGIHHFNSKNYEKAARFLNETSRDNIAPEKQYLDCAVILDTAFELKHLRDLVHKCNQSSIDQTQSLLDLAFNYWLKQTNVPNALIVYCVSRGDSWLFLNDDDN